MRITLLLLLVGCGHAAAPTAARRCEPTAVLHLRQTCADIRSGISGYYVFEVVSGAHRGKTVTLGYADGPPPPRVDNWGIAPVTLQPSVRAHGWPNECSEVPVTYDGSIQTVEPFADEASARAALDERC